MKSSVVHENRRWHFRQIIRSVGGARAAAALLNDVSTSYITIVAGPTPTRNIGDKVAAKIEATFGLPPGSLDQPPPPETVDKDPYIAAISATLHATSDSDKEFVLAIAQWIAARSLSPEAPRAGRISLKEVCEVEPIAESKSKPAPEKRLKLHSHTE